jgi:hypothetical protein
MLSHCGIFQPNFTTQAKNAIFSGKADKMGTAYTTNNEIPSFDEIRAILRDVAESQKETDRLFKEIAEQQAERQKETDRKMQETDRLIKEIAERQKETDRQMKETDLKIKENAERQKETERQMKESSERLSKELGGLGSSFGEMAEYMVKPNLLAKFGELGFEFEKAYLDATIRDSKNNIITEVDITLENGDKVMIVEVKTKPTIADVKEHLKRMRKVRAYADLKNDRRKFLGAIAGVIFHDNVKEFAFKNGFYVIEPSGETFTIAAPKDSPREW